MQVKYGEVLLTANWGLYNSGNNISMTLDGDDGDYGYFYTTNGYLEGSRYYADTGNLLIGIRSDEEEWETLLIENGVIERGVVFEEPSGYITINYYRLTEEAKSEAVEVLNEKYDGDFKAVMFKLQEEEFKKAMAEMFD